MNGDLFAFLSFAYDLFTLADNAEVQKSLLDRLRKADQYQGARYEMFVAASLLRAGFTIAFEDESDSTTSHCEFIATSKQTGRPFSVEAKAGIAKRRFQTTNDTDIRDVQIAAERFGKKGEPRAHHFWRRQPAAG